jgi:membrane-bound acyltransferase YfiQ involved in biofilm formation
MKNKRNRVLYGVLIIIVILLGISTRRYPMVFPGWFAKYSGDTLWALMVFLGIGFIFSRWSIRSVAIGSLVFSFLIEFSQLYHSQWIESIRHTTLGGLVLGYGFLWSDLVCYTIGVVVGILFENLLRP